MNQRAEPTHLLFFKYTSRGANDRPGEKGRRDRASERVREMGGTCEIFRIGWNGYDMVSIVRGLTADQARQLAAEIDGWGAVHTTVVEASTVNMLKGP